MKDEPTWGLHIGVRIARVLHVLAMWLFERSRYRTQAWLYVAYVVALAEIEMRKEITRRKANDVPPSATP